MSPSRREFVRDVGASAMLASLPIHAMPGAERSSAPEDWDMSWIGRVKEGKRKAVFDCTDIEGGNGVARAILWSTQYEAVFGLKRQETRTVLILRHSAVALSLRQAMWDKLTIGVQEKVTAQDTGEPTTHNPVADENGAGDLQRFIAAGNIAIACNRALQRFVQRLQKLESIDTAEAQRRCVAALLPGVVLQPSGVFAAVCAGEIGCSYVKAS